MIWKSKLISKIKKVFTDKKVLQCNLYTKQDMRRFLSNKKCSAFNRLAAKATDHEKNKTNDSHWLEINDI